MFRKTQNFFLKKLFMFMPSEKEWGEREKMYNNEHTHFIIHTCQFLLGKLKNCTKENYVFCTHIWTFLPLICLFNARLKIMRIFLVILEYIANTQFIIIPVNLPFFCMQIIWLQKYQFFIFTCGFFECVWEWV